MLLWLSIHWIGDLKNLLAKKVIVPIINRIIPIVADESIELWDPIGVYRVTPAHDFKSYAIAQRHGLPTDMYAFDHNNVFTDHAMIYAGKNVVEFRDNIVQYLYDIHNLQSSSDEVRNVAYSQVHKDYVHPFLTEQWVLSLDTVMQKVTDLVPSILPLGDVGNKVLALASTRDACIVSTQLTNDFVLPIIQGYESIIGLSDSLAPYKKKSVCLAAVLLSLFHEGFLSQKFDISQLIDLLFTHTSEDKTLMQDIVDFLVFVWHIPKESAQEFLSEMLAAYKNPKNTESSMALLLDQINSLDFVRLLDNGDYQFVSKVLSKSWYPLDMSLFMHDDMKNVFGALAYLHAYPKTKTLLYISDSIHDAHFVYQLMSLALLLDMQLPVIQSMGHYENMYDNYLSKQQNSYDTYCADAYRYDVVMGQQDITKSYLVVSKIWNASRYILSWNKQSLDRNTIQSKLWKVTPFLSDFDLRIVQRFTDVFTKSYSHPQERLTAILHLIVDDFCIKYLEVSKYQNNEHTPSVLLRCIVLTLHMLYPVMPFAIFHICQLTGLSIARDEIIALTPIQAQKNYKIHLLMNIVSSLKRLKDNLGLKNHEQVDVFVKASVDMVAFIKTYQQLLDTVLHVHVVDYTSNDYFDSTWYLTDTIIDIVVWLKQAAAYRTSLQHVQILLREKKEYLAHLRALMTMSPSPDKEEKIDALKVEIEKLEVEEDKLF
jgi:polyhydroxyalkanoate synthesis regulator phasin